MPVVMAEPTLSRLGRLGQRTAMRAVVKNDFIAVLVDNSLGGSHHKYIDSFV